MNGKRWIGPVVGLVVLIAAALVLVLCLGGRRRPPDETARPLGDEAAPRREARAPAVAGGFYPESPDELKTEIDTYLGAATPPALRDVRGLVAPHAGYVYSGPTAAYSFKTIQGRRYKTVIVMGPTHRYALRGASIPNVAGYETPLGTVPLSPLADTLRRSKTFTDVPQAHEDEHSIEVELPFLQTVLGDFELVPILIGEADADEIAAAILEHLDDQTLIVASSDLSHYLPYETANQIDAFTVRTIAEADADLLQLCQACGKIPVAVLLRIARDRGWHPHVLDARNSGDTAGEKDRVVGYCAVAFTEEDEPFVPPERSAEPLDEDEQQTLLELARASLEAAVKREEPPAPDETELSEKLRRPSGAFVTLTEHGELRGCIGHILPYDPLYRSVIENAAAAARRDPRFLPVTKAELDMIHVEVSVLSVPERLQAASPADLLKKLEPGKDGVYLVVGSRTSTYLPQVWEQLPDKDEFLSLLSIKAGLRADAWKDPSARIFIYHAQVFEEERDQPTE